MKTLPQIHLADVQRVYTGPEGRLWELLMGEQIHIGGMQSSMELAEQGEIEEDQTGIDLCCATGAGMRFLVRHRKVARMKGVDATRTMLDLGRRRCAEEGLADRISFLEANVCATGLPARQYDFAWGEDAWCYVEDKPKLITEAVRLTRPAATIAFTDWMEGPASMTLEEARRLMGFMKFPTLLTLAEYTSLLEEAGCKIRVATDTGRFARYLPLYLDMIEDQLTYDALKILGFDSALAQKLLGEMRFMQSLASDGKIIQGLIIARKEQ